MSQFNLLDEPWISVVYDEKGATKEVSLQDLFLNAHQYKDLAGDTKTQDFAVLRVLLAVLHTVFSRFDADGNVYEYLEVDERLKQIDPVDESDIDDYQDDLYDTWVELWKRGKFPDIVSQYLKKWRDRFYLFDEEYPFFQVRKEDIAPQKLSGGKVATRISGKNINRTISESSSEENVKVALFSPKISDMKEQLTAPEVVRWLITFQGYTGVYDKRTFNVPKYSTTKGWLYDLGAVYVKGQTLFETLLFNCILPYQEYSNLESIQHPCWEFSSDELINSYLSNQDITNLASLYTAWSRAIFIDPEVDLNKPFSLWTVKLPEIKYQDNFLETMTIWKYNSKGKYKDTYTPQKHILNQSLWRSFGLLTIKDSRKPGIMDWIIKVKDEMGDRNFEFVATSMQADNISTNRSPVDEIVDSLWINDFVLADLDENGWVPRINEVVKETKRVISETYKRYIDDIKEIRKISSISYTTQMVENLFFKIDQPFRQWLASIRLEDKKDSKVKEWREILKKMVQDEAKLVLSQGGTRDYLGIEKDGRLKNIATAYTNFEYWLKQNLKLK